MIRHPRGASVHVASGLGPALLSQQCTKMIHVPLMLGGQVVGGVRLKLGCGRDARHWSAGDPPDAVERVFVETPRVVEEGDGRPLPRKLDDVDIEFSTECVLLNEGCGTLNSADVHPMVLFPHQSARESFCREQVLEPAQVVERYEEIQVVVWASLAP